MPFRIVNEVRLVLVFCNGGCFALADDQRLPKCILVDIIVDSTHFGEQADSARAV